VSRRALLLGLAAVATPALGCGPLEGRVDEALALVLAAHPVLEAERAELGEQERQRDWHAEVSLGWTKRGTDAGGAAGPNAGVRVSIPLFDRSRRLRLMQARTAWRKARKGVVKSFLADLARLCTQLEETEERADL